MSRNSDHVAKYRNEHKLQGFCVDCHNKPVEGTIRCAAHLLKRAKYTKNYHSTNLIETRNYARNRRTKLISEGRCDHCGIILLPEEEGLRCVNCNEKIKVMGVLREFNH